MAGDREHEIVKDLYERLHPALVAYACRFVDHDAALDCAQEVFLRLMQYRTVARREIGLAYLRKMAHNLLRREHRREKGLKRANCDSVASRPQAVHPTPGAGEMPTPVSRSLADLPAGHFEAVVLTSVRGLRCDHAANALSVSSTSLIRKRDTGLRSLRARAPVPIEVRVPRGRSLVGEFAA